MDLTSHTNLLIGNAADKYATITPDFLECVQQITIICMDRTQYCWMPCERMILNYLISDKRQCCTTRIACQLGAWSPVLSDNANATIPRNTRDNLPQLVIPSPRTFHSGTQPESPLPCACHQVPSLQMHGANGKTITRRNRITIHHYTSCVGGLLLA